MKWIKQTERKPVGVTSFKNMSEWVAVKFFSDYNKKIVTGSARYCHDRNEWFINGGHANGEKDVIEWLDES